MTSGKPATSRAASARRDTEPRGAKRISLSRRWGRPEKLGVELEDADVGLALLTLRDAGYIEVEDSQPYGGESGSYTHLLVTGRGMQARLASGRSSPK